MMAFLLTDSLGGIEHYMARDSKCVLHVCVFVCVCVCTRERERERETKVENESGLFLHVLIKITVISGVCILRSFENWNRYH
jgi:hypothetical protein